MGKSSSISKSRRERRTGFLTRYDLKKTHRITYRDGKEHGEHKTIENGKVKSIDVVRQWPAGLAEGVLSERCSRSTCASLRTAPTSSRCTKMARSTTCAAHRARKDDPELRKLCGFAGAVTTSIYDGTGKVNRVQTWKDGGDSEGECGDQRLWRAQRSCVQGRQEKRRGADLGPAGKLASTITWDRGIKDGKEIVYADDGKKVAKEMLWKAGELKQLTEFYLNGNPKLKENYDGPKKKQSKTFWDHRSYSGEGEFVVCDNDGYRDWCEGGRASVLFRERCTGAGDELSAAATGRDWQELVGRTASRRRSNPSPTIRLTKAKRWERGWQLVSDEEFEADGSRKIKR